MLRTSTTRFTSCARNRRRNSFKVLEECPTVRTAGRLAPILFTAVMLAAIQTVGASLLRRMLPDQVGQSLARDDPHARNHLLYDHEGDGRRDEGPEKAVPEPGTLIFPARHSPVP